MDISSSSDWSQSYASALLIDVLQGYPYGTANSVVDKADLTTSWGNDDARQRLQSDVEGVAAEKLASEVESMAAIYVISSPNSAKRIDLHRMVLQHALDAKASYH
ncbi:MAG: hypothetical protein U1F34_04280 [Gammaproteobacteria bacterium]